MRLCCASADGAIQSPAKGHGTYTAVALEPIVSGKKVVNILKVEGAPTEFLNTRCIELTVRFDASDICVSKQAIQFENGVPYIELLLSDGQILHIC